MASTRRWTVSDGRTTISVLLVVVAVFLLCASVGALSWVLAALSLALAAAGIGIYLLSALNSREFAYVPGTARVQNCSPPPANSTSGRCVMQVIVHAPGGNDVAVRVRETGVPVAKWPYEGLTLPILVAVGDRRRVRVLWDNVRSHADRVPYPRTSSGDGPERDGNQAEPDRDSSDADDWSDIDWGGSADPATSWSADGDPRMPPPSDEDTRVIELDLLDPTLFRHPTDDREDPTDDPGSEDPNGQDGGFTPHNPDDQSSGGEIRRPRPRPRPRRAPATTPSQPTSATPQASIAVPDIARPAISAEPYRPDDITAGSAAPPVAPLPRPAPLPRRSARPATTTSTTVASAAGASASDTSASTPVGNTPVGNTPANADSANDAPVDSILIGAEPVGTGPAEVASGDGRASDPAPDISSTGGLRIANVLAADPAVPAIPSDAANDASDNATEDTEVSNAYLAITPPPGRGSIRGRVRSLGVTLFVTNLGRSVAFYRDRLGFSQVDVGRGSAVLESGDGRVVLRRVADMPPVDRRLVHLMLEVPDVHSAYDDLRAQGVEFVHRPRPVSRYEQLELWSAALRDPDGHGIALIKWDLPR